LPSLLYRPQLARLVKRPPEGDAWLHEVKFDGYRIGCLIQKAHVTLLSRNGRDWTAAFPEIVREVQALGLRDALLDGEVAVVLPDGRTSFQALQNAASGAGSRGALAYFIFDVLRLGGEHLERRPVETRKAALFDLLGRPRDASRLRYSEHVVGRGGDMFAEACRLGLEGIVSKRRDAPYSAGRADTWLKTKCVRRQELVIGGFTDPEGTRQGIGALLVGYYDASGALVFAGKVGTGFTIAVAGDLRRRLDAIAVRHCPFSPPPAGALGKRAHWVRPALVGEVEFTEWTDDGKIRHPSFQGLRPDKDPRSVVREEPGEAPGTEPPAPSPVPSPVQRGPRRRARGVAVAGVPITHPERVVYPDDGITKLEVAQFYERMEDWILPHLRDRPLTLLRCPAGLGSCFYMKHARVSPPPGTRRVLIPEKTKVGEYLVVETVGGLAALAQMGVLEIHTWNSTAAALEHPDRLVLDIDPGSEVRWPQVVEAGRLVRRLLAGVGLESFPKTTGGRGLHVVVPLEPVAGWETCLRFARQVAREMEHAQPDRYTTSFRKAGRERKLLIDYLRNNRTNTSIAAYSTRARPGATVSMPLRWRDVTPALDPASFTLRMVPARLGRRRADPWADYWHVRQRLR
jgi:bifunctional non-homologous end joining protein LigD